jgi:hypothetical protein
MRRACHAVMLQRTRLLGITGLAPFLLLTACAEPTRDVSPWSRLLPSEVEQSLTAMTLDPQGEPAVAGTLSPADKSATMPPFIVSEGFFLTMMSDTGKDLWGGRSMEESVQASSIAVTPNGDVLLLGTFFGTFSLLPDAPGPNSPFSMQTFLARFDPRGKLLWSKPVSRGEGEEVTVGLSLATNASGDAIVGGYIQGPIDTGNHVYVQGQTGFIAEYDADGNRIWIQTVEGQVGQITAITVDASGAVFAAGNDMGSLDYLPSEATSTAPGAFITRLTAYGQPLFTTRFRGSMDQAPARINDVELSPSGGIIFTGSFEGTIDFGAAWFQAYEGPKGFVARIEAATGVTRWFDPIKTTFGHADVLAVAVAADDSIYATGQYQGDELTIDGLTFGPTSGAAMFLAQLDKEGNATDGRIFDHAGQLSVGRALAVDPAGALVLAGHFIGQIELDDQELRSAPNGSSFVARLALPFASHRRE